MKGKLINLFMWGYQLHFRRFFEKFMNNVMRELGILEVRAECLLVGARIPGRANPNDVCVEPEDGKWNINIFNGLLDVIESEVAKHPMQNISYGDEPSNRDKPENIRRDSVRKAVQRALDAYDLRQGMCSFAGRPAPVDNYYVVPVLQFPSELFERFRPLHKPSSDDHVAGPLSLIHASIFHVLTEAYDELLRPDPGRWILGRSRSPEEIIRRAATSFMYTPVVAIGNRNYGGTDLFERINLLSSLMYEGAKGTGRMLLADPESGSVDMLIVFTEPVPFRESRWSRKILQMTSPEAAIIADCEKVLGLGKIAQDINPDMREDVFEIEFLDHYHWRLSCNGEVMLVSRYGIPSLPQEKFPHDRLHDTYQRLFPETDSEDIDRFIMIFEAAVDQRCGSMLVVAKDAESEANRLRGQGTKIEPTRLTPSLYRQVSRIDGAVIIDPNGVCYAVGVILDGAARSECTSSRGSRYNSAVRYVHAVDIPRLAVVVSDDQMVDVIPILHPRIRHSAIDEAIIKLESSTKDNYHQVINWLDHHRFYLNQKECDQINAALDRIGREPLEVGEIRIVWREFSAHPDLDDSYFENEIPS